MTLARGTDKDGGAMSRVGGLVIGVAAMLVIGAVLLGVI